MREGRAESRGRGSPRLGSLATLAVVALLAGCGAATSATPTKTETLVTVLPSGAASSSAPTTTNGATLFADECVRCHGPNGAGTSIAPDLQPLTSADVAAIRTQITYGGGIMPAFGKVLTKQQIDALASYVASLR
jgi:mono/diheme cytochrome c family protein